MTNKRQNGGRSKTRTAHRDAGNGQFVTKKQATRMPANQVVKERVPLPGRGDTR